jgi:hypothetical protein
MITAFTPYTKVVSKRSPEGPVMRITDRRKSFGWRIPGYLGEGFYEVEVIDLNSPLVGRVFVCHEDDITLAPSEAQAKELEAKERRGWIR